MGVKTKRDWRIELLRFIATIGIAIFHFEWIYLGNPVWFRHFYLWVEFFFVLSGFFLAKNADGSSGDYQSLKYTYGIGRKLFPAYLIGFIFCFVVYLLYHSVFNIRGILSLLWKSKWEMLYLQLSGIDSNAPMINGVTAYIPALLVASLILHYFYVNHRKLTVNLIITLVPIAIYSHIIETYENLSQWMVYENWYTIGILRGVAGISVGMLAYILVQRIDVRGGAAVFFYDAMHQYRFFYVYGCNDSFA